MLFDVEKRNHLERIVNFVASVYAPMFLRVHLKPRASDGPENAIFSRHLLLFFNQQDQTLVCEAIKKCFLKHATAWSNPLTLQLVSFAIILLFRFLLFSQRSNLCPRRSTFTKCCGYRSHLRSFLTGKSKRGPCLQYCDARFKRSIDSHNRTCERFNGKLPTVMEGKKVCTSIGTISETQADKRMIGYVL